MEPSYNKTYTRNSLGHVSVPKHLPWNHYRFLILAKQCYWLLHVSSSGLCRHYTLLLSKYLSVSLALWIHLCNVHDNVRYLKQPKKIKINCNYIVYANHLRIWSIFILVHVWKVVLGTIIGRERRSENYPPPPRPVESQTAKVYKWFSV